MHNMDNLHSYDGVESLQAYEMGEEELAKYCMLKLESARDNVRFMEEKILPPR